MKRTLVEQPKIERILIAAFPMLALVNISQAGFNQHLPCRVRAAVLSCRDETTVLDFSPLRITIIYIMET